MSTILYFVNLFVASALIFTLDALGYKAKGNKRFLLLLIMGAIFGLSIGFSYRIGWTARASDRANLAPVARNSAKLSSERTKLPKTAHRAHTEPNLNFEE